MNVNPKAQQILCFGDSNTFGENEGATDRLAANMRWTGQLQELLGNDYEIIEEGRSGRTIDMEDPEKPGRNGTEYLFPCLKSHVPLDWVVVMLGTNDCKSKFHRTPQQIADSLGGLVKTIRETTDAKILIVCPVDINFQNSKVNEYFPGLFDLESEIKSKELAKVMSDLAEKLNCGFLDANKVAKTGPDGIHLNPESHPKLAKAIEKEIK